MPSRNPACQLCPLHETAQTVCVAGNGPKRADVLFVGEAPGAWEDEKGVPFIGRAGQLFDQLLFQSGFQRNHVYVSNAVKCRPPDNRDPKTKEVKTCKTYLIQEIEEVQPKYIVALGNTAFKALTGLSGIGKYRGSPLKLHAEFVDNAVQVFCTPHPSAALRYPHFGDQIKEDLALLHRTMNDSFVSVEVPWRWDTKISIYSDVVSFDIETNARDTRDPFSKIYLVAVDGGNGAVHVLRPKEAIDELSTYATAAPIRLVGHNASRFDRIMVRAASGKNLRCDDTMLMGFLLHEEWGVAKRLNLESLCAAELGVRPWKKDVTWNWRDPLSIPWEECAQYCARDTRYTRELFLHLEKKLKADGYLWNFYDKLFLPASRALADMEERGVWINNQNVAEAQEYYEAESLKQLEIIGTVAKQYGMDDFNPRSPKQVGELLFEKIGISPTDWTPSGAASTNVGVLKTLRERIGASEAPIFDAMLQYRKCEKMKGTYLSKFLAQQDPWGRVFWWYSLTNTVTGRTSGNGQQIPREKRVRRCVGTPPGKVLLQADFSQLEMRVAASKYVFDEPNLRAAFERGDDVHRLLAAEIMHKRPEDVTSEERSNAKPPNFLFLYGGEEDMYVRTLLEDYDIVKDRADATRERDAFFRRWNQLPAGHGRVVQALQRDGFVRSALGTLRRLPNVYADDRRVRVEAFRQAINFVDQAFSCHIALTGLVLLSGAKFDVRSFQHDAYLLWVDDNEEAVRTTCTQVRRLLESGVPAVLKSEFGIDFDVPLKVDITAGTAWTDDDRQGWVA